MISSGQRLALCWGSLDGSNLFELAEAASSAEISIITVTPRHYVEQRDKGLSDAQIRRRMNDLGVSVASIDPLIAPMPGLPALAEIPAGMRWLFEADSAACWRAAAGLNASTINLTQFLGRPLPDAEIDAAVGNLVEANRAQGFATTIEFIPGTGIPDLGAAARLVRLLPDLTIMFDCWHYARSGGQLSQIEALPPKAIGGIQINDWRPSAADAPYVPMAGRLMPGDGTLPLGQILSLIDVNAPGLDVGIEVFNAELRAMNPRVASQTLAAKCRPLLAGSR